MTKTELYGGDVVLRFDPEKHNYYVTLCGEDLGKVSGATGYTGIIAKPALQYWAAKETAKYWAENVEPGVAYDEVEIAEMVSASKKARFKTSGKALNIGSITHDWMEDYINRVIDHGAEKVEVLDPKEKAKPHQIALPMNEQVRDAVTEFLAWEASHDSIEWIAAERKVYSVKYNHSGTLDGEAIIDGKRAIVDFKTSKRLYPEYLIQAACYMGCREEEERYVQSGIELDGIVILRVPKDGGAFEAVEEFDSDKLREHYKAFLACHFLKNWKKENK